MINTTERDNRSMFLHYMIENLENGLKYVGNEARVDSEQWNYIKRTIEKIDADLERLVVLVKTDKREEEVQLTTSQLVDQTSAQYNNTTQTL